MDKFEIEQIKEEAKMSKWTSEPWKVGLPVVKEMPYWYIEACLDEPVPKILAHCLKGDAERIVSCVNALAGLNPDAVKECVKVLEKLSVVDAMTDDGHYKFEVMGLIVELKCEAKQALDKARMK